MFSEIEYLGYSVSEQEITPTKRGIEAVSDFPLPRNVHDVRGFVDLCSYFRKFIENFSILAKLLYDLLQKNAVFKFEVRELEAFEVLKAKLIEAPILSIYDPRDETELHTDASALGFGAILM